MKNLVLTVDYELFFGSDPGTVENCMIRPTRRLAEILKEFSCTMTVFWDIMHFYRLTELESSVPDLRVDREMIEKQIRWLVREGHDVQMEIYPHWLDATWKNNRWRFSYNRFSLSRLWDDPDPENIQTVVGCITKGKALMEEVCRKEDPHYRVRAFRAGGYRVEPFSRITKALKLNDIRVDSSAGFGMKSRTPNAPFDFTRLPRYMHYRFDDSLMHHNPEGWFWEFAKETVRVPFYIRFLFYFLGSFVYTGKGRFGDGKRLGFTRKEQSGHLWSKIGSRYYRLTPEEMDPVRWKYLYSNARENAMVVLHAKNMSPYTIQMLHQSMANGDLRFHPLIDRLKELKVYDDL